MKLHSTKNTLLAFLALTTLTGCDDPQREAKLKWREEEVNAKELDVARREGVYGPYCRLGMAIEAALTQARGGKSVPMNLDGVSAVVALDLGFDWRATRLFLITPRTVKVTVSMIDTWSSSRSALSRVRPSALIASPDGDWPTAR